MKKTYKFISRMSPEIAELLDKANVIKIGMREDAPFGELYMFIPNPSLLNLEWF